MQPRQVKEDGRVFEIEATIETCYVNPCYVLAQDRPAALSATGWLRIFTLVPRAGAGPSFAGRWDGGSREAGKTEVHDLDIDISGVAEQEERLFKKGQSGYSGHRASRMPGRSWGYELDLQIPSGPVFKAVILLHLHRRITFSETLQLPSG